MMRKGLQKIARFLYGTLKNGPIASICFSRAVQSDIAVLGIDEEVYYVQKLVFLCEILLVGILIACLYWSYLWFDQRGYIERIERPEAHEESKEILLKAGKLEDVFLMEIEPVQLTWEEADKQVSLLSEELRTSILRENESLEQVEKDLFLPDYVEGYPFELVWKSDDEQLIDDLGTVNRSGLQEDKLVELTVSFFYKDWMWEERFAVLVQKEVLTQEEQYSRELEQFLKKAEALTRESKEWELPSSFEGEEIYYQEEQKNQNVLWLLLLMIASAGAIWIGKDQDIHNLRSKRRELFQKEYVAFVESLSLYISAGINLQQALQFCTRDYVKRKTADNVLRTALIEYQKDIKNGIGFWEAIQRLVTTADDLEYRKLAGLLNQGMLNGAQGLAVILEKEVMKVREEKRRQSKVGGERISTALLAPMMLQLGVVIALIMIPAFSGMKF
jgi:hypothetical protein